MLEKLRKLLRKLRRKNNSDFVGWCMHIENGKPCDRVKKASDVHNVGSFDFYEKGEPGAAGVFVEYCKKHCPGNCQKGCVGRKTNGV